MASFSSNTTQCIGKFYIVQADDTCWGIAQKHNLTVSDLQGLNPKVNCNNLQIGQQLCVEKMTLLRDFYSVKSGDTCWNIAKQNSISEEQLLKYNPGLKCDDLQINQTIYTGPKSAPAAGGGTTTTTTTSAPAAAGGGTTTTTTTIAPAAAGGGTTTTTTTSAPAAGAGAPKVAKNSYKQYSGQEGKDWMYTDDENNPWCMTEWKYLDEKGKVLEDYIERTTMKNSKKRWCPIDPKYTLQAIQANLSPITNVLSAYQQGVAAGAAAKNSYKMGGIENVDWIYTDDQNDTRCLTDWTYYDQGGKVLQEKIPRTTKHNSDRSWCATNFDYIRDVAKKPLAPLAPERPTCVDFDGNYILTDSQGIPINQANELSECQGLQSYNNKYKFVLQSDGNAVLYDTATKNAIWSSLSDGGKFNQGSRPYKLIFEGDDLKIMDSSPNGNVTLYTKTGVGKSGKKLYLNHRGGLSSVSDDVTTDGNIIKNQMTSDSDYELCKWRKPPATVTKQDNRGFYYQATEIYKEAESRFKTPTKKSLKKGEILFQCEGLISPVSNVMLYINNKVGELHIVNSDNDWDKMLRFKTTNPFSGDRPWPAFLIFQNDLNLVFYDGDNNVLWSWWGARDANFEGKFMVDPIAESLVYTNAPDDFNFLDKREQYKIIPVPMTKA